MKWKAYPEYKESGVEWLGKIPEKWKIESLKRICRILNGSTPKSGEPSYWDGNIAWVTPDDLGGLKSKTINSTSRMITQDGYESCGTTIAPVGSLVLSTRAPIGHLAIAGIPVCTNQGCRCLVFYREISNHFYYYQLSSARNELESLGQGSTFKELGKDKLAAIRLTHPPVYEQRTIATFLDRKTSAIDALIEKKQQQIDLLQKKRSALISHAVTKGLDPNAKMKDSGMEWLDEIPEHWGAGNIRRFATMKTGHTPSRNHPEYWENCTIPWFTLADVWQLRDGKRKYLEETKEKISKIGLKNSAAELLPAGTVVFSRTASVGFSGIMPVPMATTQDFWNWICGPKLIPEYLLYLFRAMTQEFEALTMGSTHKTIYQPIAASITICLPPLSEQYAISDFLNRQTTQIDKIATKVKDSIAILQKYRTALITAAVTGKIDIRKEVA